MDEIKMDDQGFIFTTDAALALVIFIVFSTSIISYQMMPVYMGEDHQHLEGLADSALSVMYQDGTLHRAAVLYANGNTTGAQQVLNSSLDTLIPSDTGYKLTLSTYPSIIDNRGLLYSKDTVTRVKVISGPPEGWMGRAWYKIENVEFVNQPQHVTTTLWNFHNWLTNFDPWGYGYGRGNINHNPYWGGGNAPQNIQFSIPPGAIINRGTFLLGSSNLQNRGNSYGANVVINGIDHLFAANTFTFLNFRPGTPFPVYNHQGAILATELHTGINNYYVNFINSTNTNDMPWFTLIGDYMTSIRVPTGIMTNRINFNNVAGQAVPNPQDLDGNGRADEYGRIYDLNTGSVTSFSNRRVIAWNDLLNRNHSYTDGVPFVITGTPNGVGTGSAVSTIQDINIPEGSRISDGYVVLNTYGGVDNALVEVWDGTQWNTAFCSFNLGTTQYSARTDGYGNIPGIIYIGDYLRTGNNKVRITAWDHVPSNDYDLVGLVDCYSSVSYTRLPIRWDNFPYNSYQSNNNQHTETRQFTIGSNKANEVLLFVGVGTDSRHLKVDYGNDTVLYDGDTIPFSLDLGNLDAAGPHVITDENGKLKRGTYNLRVTVTGPGNAWESGDWNGNAELFSGTRIAVITANFRNIWTTAYNETAAGAKQNARSKLINELAELGITPDPSLILDEALYTGDMPNTIPVRLDLWKK